MQWIRNLLSTRLMAKLLTSMLLALLPMVIIVAITYFSAKDASFQNSERIMKLIVRNGAKEINQHLMVQRNIFKEWTAEDTFGMAIEFATTNELESHFRSLVDGNKGVAVVLLTDQEGKILQAVARDADAKKFINEKLDSVGQLSSGKDRLAILARSPLLVKLGKTIPVTLVLSMKTHNSDGKHNGFFIAMTDLSILQEKLETVLGQMRSNGFAGASLFILDMKSETALAHANRDMIGKTPRLAQTTGKWFKEAKSESIRQFAQTDGTVFAMFSPLTGPNALFDKANNQGPADLLFAGSIPEDDILSKVQRVLWFSIVVCAAGIVLLCFISFFVANLIAKPLNRVTEGLKAIADGEGDLTVRLPVTSKDEIGQLALSFNTFIEKLQFMIRDIASNAATLNTSSGDLNAIAQQISSASDATSRRSENVSSAAEQMSANMKSVAMISQQATANMSGVASAAEQMSSTVNEIAKSSENARIITNKAVSKAGEASEQVDALGNAANEISKVTEVITEISEQTNLLALNATIEAARAGDAGKGFAVVANEIKELARQTAMATQEIKTRIEGIQGTTSSTVVEIQDITKVIHEVNEIVSTIAAAVEEQSFSTQEIAKNVAMAAGGVEDVNKNMGESSAVSDSIAQDITDVNQVSSEMAASSTHLSNRAKDLSLLSEKLNEMVGKFRIH